MALTKVRGSGIDADGQEIILDADTDTTITADTDDQIDIKTGGSDRVTIDSSGNVGIGTSSPSTELHLSTSTQGDIVTFESTDAGAATGPNLLLYRNSSSPADDDNIGAIRFRGRNDNSENVDYAEIESLIVDASDGTEDGALAFRTVNGGTSAEHMRVRSDGIVTFSSCAINTTSTTVASRGSRFAINQNNASGFAIAIDNVRNDTASSGGILITNNETSGTFDLMSFLSSGDSEIGSINTNNSSTSFNTSSDYRLKENVVTDWDATTRLKQLKPSRFNFIADADTTVDGFLAHEVSSIVPEAITGEKDAVDEDGNIKTQKIDQSKLVPLLTKALQEAVTKIETLEAKVTALENA